MWAYSALLDFLRPCTQVIDVEHHDALDLVPETVMHGDAVGVEAVHFLAKNPFFVFDELLESLEVVLLLYFSNNKLQVVMVFFDVQAPDPCP